ncbi:MAG: aldehyde dehydrogenase family protein [Amaricoccus sp.]
MQTKLYIDGAWVAPAEGGTFPVIDPATEEVVHHIPAATAADADAAVRAARAAFDTGVRLVNQPAFCYHIDAAVEVDGLGTIPVSVAYGGMTYALVDAAALGFAIEPSEARDLCLLGQRIKTAAAAQLAVAHPDTPAMPALPTPSSWGRCAARPDGSWHATPSSSLPAAVTARPAAPAARHGWRRCTPRAR